MVDKKAADARGVKVYTTLDDGLYSSGREASEIEIKSGVAMMTEAEAAFLCEMNGHCFSVDPNRFPRRVAARSTSTTPPAAGPAISESDEG